MNRFRKILNPLYDAYYELQKEIQYHTVRLRKRPFQWSGDAFQYAGYRTNFSYYTERTVELPIAFRYLKQYHDKQILEIGNVTGLYRPATHDVIDKYEKGPHIQNVDVVTYIPEKKYDLIISISTLEHVGFDESRYAKTGKYNSDVTAFLSAVENTKKMLAPGGCLFITLPMGYNPFVDEQLNIGFDGCDVSFLKRISQRNLWKQVPYEEVKGIRYGAPFGPGANGLAIVRYFRP